jgi:dihydrolipoamide dehydrogenase
VDALRAHKDKVVGKLTGGLAGMAKGRKVDIRGYGHFLDPNHIEVEETTGTSQDKTGAKKVVKFKQCIIAAGSAAVHLPFIPRDPRIVDSTGALELRFVPARCWSSAAASSAWKWPPSIPPSAPASTWSR